MTSTDVDPADLAIWHGMDVCQDAARAHPGIPILIKNSAGVACSPQASMEFGRPLVDLLVMTDGVLVIAYLPTSTFVLDQVFARFPADVAEIYGAEFRQWLDAALATVIAALPAQDRPVTP
jgi:hypothetical protein